MKPLYSIIIPTLNEEEYIGRLLSDLTKQTEKKFEVIVVDSKSHDQTVERAKAFQKEIPLKIFSNKAKNVSVQRNLGAAHASNRYLVFFDADVQLPHNYLKSLREEIEKHEFKFLTTYVKTDSQNVYDGVLAQVYNVSMELSLFIDEPVAPGFNMIIAKSAFKKVGGFRKDIVYGEDQDLSVRLHKGGFPMTLLKKPRLIFSLRRYRAEGRLTVLRKNARAALHIFTKGPITKNLFAYPMGGGWYKTHTTNGKNRQVLFTAKQYMRKFMRMFVD